MDDELTDLIEQLLVQAAGIMEDASAAVLMQDAGSCEERIATARRAGGEVQALATAAAVLLNRLA